MGNNAEENSSTDPIEELERIVNNVEQKGEEVSEHGREVTRTGQFMVDFARATKAVIPYLPPNTNLEYLIDDWRAYDWQAERLLVDLRNVWIDAMSSAETTAGSATLSVTGSFANAYQAHTLPKENSHEAQVAISNLYAVAGRMGEASRVEELIKDLGLDIARKGKKSPLHLFQTAHGAFEKPVIKGNPISTSLIPMRECMRLVIDELLKRRPVQEKTGNEQAKILSIGRQLKKDTVLMDTIDSLARQWHEEILDKDLSPAKEQDVLREEWSIRLQRATQFLFSLLSGLDTTKMKSR